ncbi:hypothetical protein Y11_10251 [Yersinia enterocolitica subsp. palearctica Y11]|uniref:Uncharacterized protein n=1 Tax=Yersinia enterocolitica subsp. palearctica serotype O:3 (strain DSM 13030 / CIP 106945 / Y11) TaxID=930944 RepID=A0A0H3NPP3_YERE1|nr:hypothetical protein Y11_10251 [Yersinia enterocolitica subsp. palearctica Y11]SUP67000.1 Uncharacterised protein [Yersinia enterocolitica]
MNALAQPFSSAAINMVYISRLISTLLKISAKKYHLHGQH